MKRYLILFIGILFFISPALADDNVFLVTMGGPNWSAMGVDLIPKIDDTYDIGSSTKEWKDLYVDGVGYIDTAEITNLGIGTTPTYPLHIKMLATDPYAIYVDGTTNDYTGADAAVAQYINRDINRGTGAINNYAGWQSYLTLKHTDATIAGDYFAYGNITRLVNDGARITNEGATDRQYWETGAYNAIRENGTYDTDSTGVFNTKFIGTYSWVWAEAYHLVDTGGNTPANVFESHGVEIKVENLPTFTGAPSATINSAGVYIDEVTGNTEGTSTGYGIYINSVSGSDTNYAIYDASGADNYLSGNIKTAGIIVPGNETITCASDVCTENIAKQIHFIISEGGAEVNADALALDNGTVVGQEATFIFKTESDAGDTIVIDTAQQVGWSDFTMAEVGDSVTFIWDGTNWTIKSAYQAGTY